MRVWLGGLLAAELSLMAGCVLTEDELERDSEEQLQRISDWDHDSAARRPVAQAPAVSRPSVAVQQPAVIAAPAPVAAAAPPRGAPQDELRPQDHLRMHVADAADGAVAGSVRWVFGSTLLLDPFEPSGRSRMSFPQEVPVFKGGDVVNRRELRPGTPVNVFLKRRAGEEPEVIGVLILGAQEEYILRTAPLRDPEEESDVQRVADAPPVAAPVSASAPAATAGADDYGVTIRSVTSAAPAAVSASVPGASAAPGVAAAAAPLVAAPAASTASNTIVATPVPEPPASLGDAVRSYVAPPAATPTPSAPTANSAATPGEAPAVANPSAASPEAAPRRTIRATGPAKARDTAGTSNELMDPDEDEASAEPQAAAEQPAGEESSAVIAPTAVGTEEAGQAPAPRVKTLGRDEDEEDM